MPHMVTLSVTTRSEMDWLPAFHLMSDIAMEHGDQFAQMSVSSVDLEDLADEPEHEPAEEFYDENTLAKVYDAIRTRRLGISPSWSIDEANQEAEEIVNALQNAGILFREIKK